ncbi:MAG: ABC transporter permease, partial [Hyphomicrobiales bacterium]|nr:ABC transporter permease [Hyphomicrobiales bacterium]
MTDETPMTDETDRATAEIVTAAPNTGSANWMRNLVGMRSFPLLVALIAYILVIAMIEPAFLSAYNIRNVLLQVSVAGIVTVGMTMMIIAGQIDLSVGFLISFVATVMAIMVQADIPGFWVALSGIVMCVALQAATGLVVAIAKVESFIITLGSMAIYQGFALLLTRGAEIPLDGKFQVLGRSRLFEIPTPVYIFITVCITFALILRYTVFGRRLFAVGENNQTAYLAGINVILFKIKVY